jgi:hypothetical protein
MQSAAASTDLNYSAACVRGSASVEMQPAAGCIELACVVCHAGSCSPSLQGDCSNLCDKGSCVVAYACRPVALHCDRFDNTAVPHSTCLLSPLFTSGLLLVLVTECGLGTLLLFWHTWGNVAT